jgi:hypothetical protein
VLRAQVKNLVFTPVGLAVGCGVGGVGEAVGDVGELVGGAVGAPVGAAVGGAVITRVNFIPGRSVPPDFVASQ